MTATIRFLFPLSLLIVWAATSPPLSSEQSAQAELTRLEAELPALMLRGDATAVARLTADDFVAYDPQGCFVRRCRRPFIGHR